MKLSFSESISLLFIILILSFLIYKLNKDDCHINKIKYYIDIKREFYCIIDGNKIYYPDNNIISVEKDGVIFYKYGKVKYKDCKIEE